MTIEIRQAQVGEAPLVADLWLRSRRAAVGSIPPCVYSDAEVHHHVAADFDVEGGKEVWVATDDGVIVAMMVLAPGWLDQLYLEPGWNNQGIGSALVALAKSRQPGGLDLWAFQSNLGARRFYERHGFVAVEETDGDNVEGEPDVRYRWSQDITC